MKRISCGRVLVECVVLAMVSAFPALAQVCPPTVFDSPVHVPAAYPQFELSAGDFNGDGRPDLIVGDATQQSLVLRLATGPLTYAAGVTLPGSGSNAIGVADFNQDGKSDTVAGSSTSSGPRGVFVQLGNGDGTFQTPLFTDLNTNVDSIAIADVDADGKPDLVVSSYVEGYNYNVYWTLFLLLGNGDGTFRLSATQMTGMWYGLSQLLLGDMDGDGRPEIAVSTPYAVSVYPLDGAGGFGTPLEANCFDCRALGLLDVNGIGRKQLVYEDSSNTNGRIMVLTKTGGSLTTADAGLSIPWSYNGATADFDGDGGLDLAVFASGNGSTVTLLALTGNASAPFRALVIQGTEVAYRVLARDLDGDGRPDLAGLAGTPTETWISIARNATGGSSAGIYVLSMWQPLCPFTSAQASAPDFGPGTTYLWSAANGWISSDPTQRTIDFSAATIPGQPFADVQLSVTVQAPGCSPMTGTRSVEVSPHDPGIMTAPAAVCPNSTGNVASVPDFGPGTVYDWSTYGLTITSGQGTPSITFTAPPPTYGLANLNCYVTLPQGCSLNYGVTIESSLEAWFPSPSAICAGSAGSASVADKGPGATYAWSIQDGSIVSGQGTTSILYTSDHTPYTNLTLTVTSPSGCTVTYTTLAGVFAPPSSVITAPAAVCNGSTGNVASVPDGGNGISYAWSIQNGTITSAANTRTITFSAGPSGQVALSCNVSRTTYAPCTSTGTKSVTIDAPSTAFTLESPQCTGSTYTVSVADAGPGATYTWSGNIVVLSGAGTRQITYRPDLSYPPSGGRTPLSGDFVTLYVSVRNAAGCQSSSSQSAPAVQLPTGMAAPASVCSGGSGYTARVFPLSGATYAWTITNGTITSGLGTDTITFTPGTSGSVGLSCAIAYNGCSATPSATVAIIERPAAPSLTAPASTCAGRTGLVASVPYAGFGVTYHWSLTGGTIVSGDGTPSISFTAGASGTAVVSVTEEIAPGCSSSASASIVVNALPSADFAVPPSQTICTGTTQGTSVPDAGPGASYTWSVTNGTITGGQGTASMTYVATNAGTTSVSLTVQTAAGCSASASKSLTVNTSPSATITAPASLCANGTGYVASVADAGPSAQYAWTVNGSPVSAGNSITFNATPAGAVTISVQVTNASGCVASGSTSIPVVPLPSAQITTAASICSGGSGNASVPSAGAGASYAWTIANGSITGGQGTSSIGYTAGASGSVTLGVNVVSGAGCANGSSRTVAINALPSAAITAPTSTCAGSTGNAASVPDAGAGATYAWTITNGTITAGAGTRSVTFTAGASGTATLNVTVVNGSGCSASSSRGVTVNVTPSATITAPATVKKNSKNNAASVPSAGAGATYTWTVSNGTITAGAGTTSITFTAGNSGNVSLGVTVRNAAGCNAVGSRNVPIN